MFSQGSVLITGGTGFLGRHLVRRMLADGVGRIRVMGRDEKKHYDLRCEFASDLDRIEPFIGDVRDAARVEEAVRGVELVVHAAAMKHITHAESHPLEAVQTNVLGAVNVIRACRDGPLAPAAVFISTDKAAAPVNVYGATKMVQEALFRASGIPCAGARYGNVLSSAGSVVPFFRVLAQSGRSLPVTHPNMTRFLITVQEALALVEAASHAAYASPGTVFVPKPRSARVLDVAEAFCSRYGVAWHVIGPRPGEKMHEVLVSERDAGLCEDIGPMLAIRPAKSGFEGLDRAADVDLAEFASNGRPMTPDEVRAFLEAEGEL